MPPVDHPFGGTTFLPSMRRYVDKDHGAFVGADSTTKLSYAVLDTSWYTMSVITRDRRSTFIDAAGLAGPLARVVINGQWFGLSWADYCVGAPCSVMWQGEIVQNGTVRKGVPPSAPLFRHVGQTFGCSTPSYSFTTGDPGNMFPVYRSAMGRLLPLVEGGRPAGDGALGSALSLPASSGLPFVALSIADDLLVVAAQEDGKGTLTVRQLRDLLVATGLDYAVLCDASNSAALLVDGQVLVSPNRLYKNPSIPTGIAFMLTSYGSISAQSSLVVAAGTTHAGFQTGERVTGTRATLKVDAQTMVLELADWGSIAGRDVENALEQALPLRLSSPRCRITSPQTLTAPKVQADIQLRPEVTVCGRVTGTMTVQTTAGLVRLEVAWAVDRL